MGQVTDWEGKELAIGTPVTVAMRRLYDQEGVVRYGLKFIPQDTPT
jgi:hypothetical protein